MLSQQEQSLILRHGNELLKIEPWGENSFRVRSSKYPKFQGSSHALLPAPKLSAHPKITIDASGSSGSITNGDLTAKINAHKNILFYNQDGKLLLKGYQRNRIDDMTTTIDHNKAAHFNSALNINSREFKAHIGGDYELYVRFESNPEEKLFGMGQYQQDFLDLKNAKLELAHRNSQASVPFVLSNQGYGFLWNNPAIGDVHFAKNITEWHAISTKEMDFWITDGDQPSQIEEQYAAVTGTVPMMPEYGLGYWQCKLRYRTQDELLQAAREFKRRHLPIDVIVIDYFHWPKSGEFCFDPAYWPDPRAMINELHEMGIKLMVSVWPTIDETSSHYKEMAENGYLIQVERGVPIAMNFLGNNGFADFTNPGTRRYLWALLKKNYYDLGVDLFWLDEAEPEYTVYDFDNYRYYRGSNLQVGNIFPAVYSKMVYDGMKSVGQKEIVNLVRSAWAGSQRYGALVWSGDIDSSFQSLRNQLAIGLNIAIAGIPWWTTDIGGFHGGINDDPDFRELVTRWFQFSTFCPVMRMHGDREPHTKPLSVSGGGKMPSGAPTEPWAYGDQTYNIMIRYMQIREHMRDYLREQMAAAHKKGTPIIRPLFYDFPTDQNSWAIENQYMFGHDLLIAPIMYAQITQRDVYLPQGTDWVNVYTQETKSGGQTIVTEAPIEEIPVFVRKQVADVLLPLFK
ncbi:glycoside hydrolase family 31 protein [Sporolactobacillus shoreicorticis]|uniref:Glycoside hydrolase family 31 protein n=1 Tax=Sporolactobacillus shoreicorticis TaxID=1923877 RepID=A0ABW5S942_9BACL|nr:glycoside hydrolase family 31 protein [Sporolactobacillus shoreicorticis]MCO7127904.1 glycoside hydrolase family 31 protein [Sporolactobacillus shoreicorticis]